VQIGNFVKIQNYVSVFHGVSIRDGVFVGPHVCFTNDLNPRAINADGSPKSADDWVCTNTVVEYGAAIGANSTIVCGVTIGSWALVGAGSVVTKSVPDHGLVVGNPARLIGYVCKCGRRASSQDAARTGQGCSCQSHS
jgi:acetyltransferase-like isoleucine patch superfamily enzyme